jgi:hypothetical protein
MPLIVSMTRNYERHTYVAYDADIRNFALFYSLRLMERSQKRYLSMGRHDEMMVSRKQNSHHNMTPPNDVYLGRGGGTNALRQGSLYRGLILDNAEDYAALPPKAKRQFARERIVQPIHCEGGSFYVRKPAGGWIICPPGELAAKVMQALRDCKKTSSTLLSLLPQVNNPAVNPASPVQLSLLPPSDPNSPSNPVNPASPVQLSLTPPIDPTNLLNPVQLSMPPLSLLDPVNPASPVQMTTQDILSRLSRLEALVFHLLREKEWGP